HIAGEVRAFRPELYLDKRDLRRTDRFVHFALAASQEAIQNAGLSITESTAERVGVYIGTAFGGLESTEAMHKTLLEKGPNRVSRPWPLAPLSTCVPCRLTRRPPRRRVAPSIASAMALSWPKALALSF